MRRSVLASNLHSGLLTSILQASRMHPSLLAKKKKDLFDPYRPAFSLHSSPPASSLHLDQASRLLPASPVPVFSESQRPFHGNKKPPKHSEVRLLSNSPCHFHGSTWRLQMEMELPLYPWQSQLPCITETQVPSTIKIQLPSILPTVLPGTTELPSELSDVLSLFRPLFLSFIYLLFLTCRCPLFLS